LQHHKAHGSCLIQRLLADMQNSVQRIYAMRFLSAAQDCKFRRSMQSRSVVLVCFLLHSPALLQQAVLYASRLMISGQPKNIFCY